MPAHPFIASRYHALRRLGQTRAAVAKALSLTYAQAWALDLQALPHNRRQHNERI